MLEITQKIGKNRFKIALLAIASFVVLIVVSVILTKPDSAQAYEYSCGNPPEPLRIVEGVMAQTLDGKNLFLGRAIVGDGNGLSEGNRLSEIPVCVSNDPLFSQEGNLFVTLNQTGENLYVFSAVLVHLDNPFGENPQH